MSFESLGMTMMFGAFICAGIGVFFNPIVLIPFVPLGSIGAFIYIIYADNTSAPAKEK